YAVWGLLLHARYVAGGKRSFAPSYWFAACATGALLAGNSHVYDMVLLALFVPYLFDLWGHDGRLGLGLYLAAIAAAMPTRQAFLKLVRLAHAGSPTLVEWLESSRTLA